MIILRDQGVVAGGNFACGFTRLPVYLGAIAANKRAPHSGVTNSERKLLPWGATVAPPRPPLRPQWAGGIFRRAVRAAIGGPGLGITPEFCRVGAQADPVALRPRQFARLVAGCGLAAVAHDRIGRPKQRVGVRIARLPGLVLAFRAIHDRQHRLA